VTGSSQFFVRPMFFARTIALVVALAAFAAEAHDSSTYGGLYRSRDRGATWLPADAGVFIGAANALAIDPKDSTHLLYGTDSRLLQSRNGARDWVQIAPQILVEPIFAVAFDPDGRGALVATGSAVLKSDDLAVWQATKAPAGAAPVRAIIHGAQRVYLAGAQGLFVSGDRGKSWVAAGKDLPAAPVQALLVAAKETIYVLAQGRLWMSVDQGRTFAPRDAGLPQGRVEAIASDSSGSLWAAAANRIYRSADGGANWRPHGNALSEQTLVQGLAVFDGGAIVNLTTQRGLVRSTDGAQTWAVMEGTLPLHLEAKPLVADPREPGTLYAGFALRPYAESLGFAEAATKQARASERQFMFGVVAVLVALATAGIGAFAWQRMRRSRGVLPSVSAQRVEETPQ
jgi:photosystem II stability/assembly factor-like uncharacterized protein